MKCCSYTLKTAESDVGSVPLRACLLTQLPAALGARSEPVRSAGLWAAGPRNPAALVLSLFPTAPSPGLPGH